MKKLVFTDICCPKPYDGNTLKEHAMGGTEATVVRVAELLSKEYEVHVGQHNRIGDKETVNNVNYFSLSKAYNYIAPDYVVCLRSTQALSKYKDYYPKAKFFLWCHDLAGGDLSDANAIRYSQATIITVSDFHKSNVLEFLKARERDHSFIKIKRIYNPVDESLVPNDTPRDPNKLVFFSSPHKGLARTIELFQRARSFNENLKLYIANPGYIVIDIPQAEGLINLGTLPHHMILKHVRESLCIFYPNTVFPETFGLVLAEANAVGIPVLTHPIGAANEVLDHPAQLIDCTSNKTVIDTLLHWHAGYSPSVRLDYIFRANEVRKEWRKLLK